MRFGPREGDARTIVGGIFTRRASGTIAWEQSDGTARVVVRGYAPRLPRSSTRCSRSSTSPSAGATSGGCAAAADRVHERRGVMRRDLVLHPTLGGEEPPSTHQNRGPPWAAAQAVVRKNFAPSCAHLSAPATPRTPVRAGHAADVVGGHAAGGRVTHRARRHPPRSSPTATALRPSDAVRRPVREDDRADEARSAARRPTCASRTSARGRRRGRSSGRPERRHVCVRSSRSSGRTYGSRSRRPST